MKKQFTILLILCCFFSLFAHIYNADATSGACSSHNGVDCSRGRQIDGKVYCNDGWTDSIVKYDYMVKCENNNKAYCNINEYLEIEKEYNIEKLLNQYSELVDKMQVAKSDFEIQILKLQNDAILSQINNAFKLIDRECESIGLDRKTNENYNLYLDEFNKEQKLLQEEKENQEKQLIELEKQKQYLEDRLKGIESIDITKTINCPNHSNLKADNLCYCDDGYRNVNNICITHDEFCKNQFAINYYWDNDKFQCIVKDNIIAQEKSLATKIDEKLSKRVSGNILLQVESKGEGWYVNPDNKKKYYLGKPSDAFSIMRNLGLGIKNYELEKYLNSKFQSRLAGKIMLDVEKKGEAYYINPKDLKGYFLNKPSDAFKVMRNLGLGITNTDIRKIEVGEI